MARRLLLSYLAVIGLTVALLAVIVQLATSQTFSRYLSDQAGAHSEMLPVMLAGYYTAHGTWEGVQPNIDQASLLIGAQVTLADAHGHIVAASRRELVGQMAGADLGLAIPVAGSGGATVGTVYAVGLGVLLARSMSRPLAEMSRAAERMAGGDYAVRVPLRGPEEVTALASAFNQMAQGPGAPGTGGTGPASRTPAGPAQRWRAAARGDCACPDQPAQSDSGRRADGQPG